MESSCIIKDIVIKFNEFCHVTVDADTYAVSHGGAYDSGCLGVFDGDVGVQDMDTSVIGASLPHVVEFYSFYYCLSSCVDIDSYGFIRINIMIYL